MSEKIKKDIEEVQDFGDKTLSSFKSANNSVVEKYKSISLPGMDKVIRSDYCDLESVAESFKKNNFECTIVPNLDAAVTLVLDKIIPESKAESLSFGGSVTVEKSDLLAKTKEIQGLKVIDTYDRSSGLELMVERRRQALLVDLFISSANAISAQGKVFLLDLLGNRTAAVQFGPKQVVLLVGRNKLVKDSHSAMHRVRNIAAPANAKRLSRKTPCVKTGKCMDCSSPDRICGSWTIVEWSHPAKRIHLVLIDEDLGF